MKPGILESVASALGAADHRHVCELDIMKITTVPHGMNLGRKKKTVIKDPKNLLEVNQHTHT